MRYSDRKLDLSVQTDRPSPPPPKSLSQEKAPAKELGRVDEGEDVRSKFLRDQYLQQLTKRNDQLRTQLRDISEELTVMLAKRKGKKRTGPQRQEEGDKHVQKELKNAYLQIEQYKKVIARYKSMEEGEVAQNKLVDLQNLIRRKEDEIESLKHEMRGLRNVKQLQQRQMELGVNNTQLHSMTDDYKREQDQLKARLRQLGARERTQEIEYKKQQAYQIELQKKYRELNNEFHPGLKRPEEPTIQPTEITDQEWSILKHQRHLLKKEHDEFFRAIDLQLSANRKVQQDCSRIKKEIGDKDKEIEALAKKITQLKLLCKQKKQQTEEQFFHPPPQPEEVQPVIGNIEHLKADLPEPQPHFSSKPAEETPQLKKWDTKFKKDDRGLVRQGAIKFSDEDIVPIGSRMIGATVWIFKGVVSAITVTYQKEGKRMKGCLTHSGGNSQAIAFDLTEGDYIKKIGGAVNSENGLVQYLVMVSKSGRVERFGNLTSKQKQFNFAIGESEIPDAIYGATYTSKQDREQRLCLFGCRISVDTSRKLI